MGKADKIIRDIEEALKEAGVTPGPSVVISDNMTRGEQEMEIMGGFLRRGMAPLKLSARPVRC